MSRIVAVPKPHDPDEIRICVDMREANKAIIRTRHVTPTIEELVSDMHGATIFSKLDLKAGYHQLVLKPESRHITTFSTHCGLYRYKRLSFGINSAAEVFQHTIQTVIEGIHGSRNVSDDIIVYGKNKKDHDRALQETLKRLHTAGLTLNQQKCVFRQPEIKFYGFIFSADGLKPDPGKVTTLKETPTPTNRSELRSFLGMAQYSARFIEKFATLTEPLRQLTKQDVTWTWTEKEDKAFRNIKEALCKSATLQYFDISKESEILVDASPVGIAGLLTQDNRPVCYASRALSETEQRYSQTEREALAIVWACEHFDIFVRGNKFSIVTDHRPLLTIWDKPSPPARIARWALRLQPYDVTIKYKPGKDNPADYLSRHPSLGSASSREERIAEEFVNFVASTSTPYAITLEDVKTATSKDANLQAIINTIKSGQWHNNPQNIDKEIFLSFRNAKDELCVNAEENVILRGSLLVIPSSLQAQIIKLAHEGHQGINKTKALLRSKVWFPRINAKTESAIQSCIPCQANTHRLNHEPLKMSDLPKGPWLHLSMDFCGPLPSGESLLVMTDEYSRYPVVEILRSTSVESLIPVVDKVFSLFGYPTVIKTDNGPQFKSSMWSSFMKSCGVKHRRITPLWPKANAQAENFNKPLMKAIRAATIQRRNWKQELYKFCRMYRTTPHCTTNYTPHFLLFGREPKTKLPEMQSSTSPVDLDLRIRDAIAKQKMKAAADARHNAKRCQIEPGDTVLVKQVKQNKLSTNFDPTPLQVTNTKGPMITALKPDGSTVTRNSSLFRRLPSSIKPTPLIDPGNNLHPENESSTSEEEFITMDNLHPSKTTNPLPFNHPQPTILAPTPRRSKRQSQKPHYLEDYVCS